ncbi:MAG: hypothetical protein AAGC88_13235, partial [Bacteroidota bacterium]
FVVLVIILLGGGGYYGYQYWLDNRSINTWSLVPEDAYFVYESEDAIGIWQTLDSTKTGLTIKSLPAFQRAQRYLNSLDSLSGDQDNLVDFFRSNPLLISGHAIAKDRIDFLFVIEVQNIKQHSLVTTLANQLGEQYNKSTRTYLGNTISEITHGESMFTYIYYKNYFVGSFTPYLVEDAIRTFTEEDRPSFLQAHRALFQLAKLEQDEGNLYINTGLLKGLTETFINNINQEFGYLSELTDHTFLDLQLEQDMVVFNGFSINDDGQSNLLDAFDGNPGAPFSIHSLIPNRTSWLLHFSFTDVSRWMTDWKSQWPTDTRAVQNYVNFLKTEYDIELAAFNTWMGGEIALIGVENPNPELRNLITIVDTKDIGEAYKQLNIIGERMAQNDNDSVYSEPYGDLTIRQLKIDELPQLLFGPGFRGFETTFYLPFDGRLIFANNDQVLKQLIDDIGNEEVWGKSVRTMQFFDQLDKEANLNLIVDSNRSWKSVTDQLRPEWATFAEENGALLKSFEMVAIQFSNIDDKYYSNVALFQPGEFDVKQGATDYQIEKTISFPHKIVTRPFFSRSHVDRTIEFAMQDSAGNFYHLNNELEVLWSDSIPGRVISDVDQIDYFKSKKLQFAFATNQQLHGIDRTGESLPDYPIDNPSGDPIDYFKVIDYDNTKNYRLAVTSSKGAIYLMDKSGKRLDGWNPLKVNGPLSSSTFHLRITSRDLIIAPQLNGLINVLNRRGSSYPGFPLDLKSPIENGLYVNVGSSLANTSLTTINQNGEIISFNLTGGITRRDQLYKPKPATSFDIVEDALGNGYLIGRKDDTRVSVLDQSGNVLFEKDYLSTGEIDFQYYDFGAGVEIIVIIDREQAFTYLYNRSGTLINFRPLESAYPIGLTYSPSNKEFKIFKVFENEFSVLTLEYNG